MMNRMSAFGILILAATAAVADQPWDTAVEKAWGVRDLVPATVETHTEIFDGGGEKLEIVETTERLGGWSAGEESAR